LEISWKLIFLQKRCPRHFFACSDGLLHRRHKPTARTATPVKVKVRRAAIQALGRAAPAGLNLGR